MRSEVWKNGIAHAGFSRRALAVLMALCLVLSQLNSGFMVAYATNGGPVAIQVGSGVTAELADGVLTLSGTGDTDDFTAENAPFSNYAADVRSLVVEEGVTYLGAYLFYGLSQLEGELVLPESIVGFGDYAFSGESPEASPHFSVVRNLFESGEVARPQAVEQQPSDPEPLQTKPATEQESGGATSGEEDSPLPAADEANRETAADAGGDGGAGYAIEKIVQQEIAHPETLFSQGQSGEVVCSSENASFLEAALAAGYAPAEESATAALDGEGEAELPLTDESMDQSPLSAAATADETIVYVDQEGGDDANQGTQVAPLKTLDGAAKKMRTKAEGGTAENNRVVILGTYDRSAGEAELFMSRPVPATISGAEDALLTTTASETDHPLNLHEDLIIESIKVDKIDHIYGNGYHLTIGEGVENKTGFYLYGFGNNSLDPARKSASLTVKSGTIARIAGYIRSLGSLDCQGYTSTVTIDGTAKVNMIVAGSASGEIRNANVTINVKDGTIGKLIGGNQGFSKNPSPYSGKTLINVSGGKVTNLYGAGSGRENSIPTYQGQLDIKVAGGEVDNLYGAGSAAYVTSDESTPSQVSISVSGGQVGGLFAAGKGWDKEANLAQSESFVGGVKSEDFGSLTGNAFIAISGNASVDNVYASGEGDADIPKVDGTKRNAYVKGKVSIDMSGGTVGSIYGGGKGSSDPAYKQCARVTGTDSSVQVRQIGGTVLGSIYGGGQMADVECSTTVTLSDGTVQGNVYGGGAEGEVKGATTVNIEGGTVQGSVFGGALGKSGTVLVSQGSTVNMTGGKVRGNLYGGSQLSDDGAAVNENVPLPDLIVTNLVGGTVLGNVFGGGYKGTVNGSTHMHVGEGAMGACAYYQANKDKMPNLTPSPLTVEGSVYAGGDSGGEGSGYDTITVRGTSHVYIDGDGYGTGAVDGSNAMNLGGGVFGSGASCDAGKTRLVTLKDYGKPVYGKDGTIEGATRNLTAIQRADRVLLLNSHVELLGQSDVANADKTASYSLNRIGDHGPSQALGDMGNGLVLQGGSTLVLQMPATELAALRSLDAQDNEASSGDPSNTLLLDTGTLLRVSNTDKQSGSDAYGPVKGYMRLLAGESAEGFVYARISPSESGTMSSEVDGGFVDKDGKRIDYTKVQSASPQYRFWRVAGEGEVNVARQAVLTARTLVDGDEGYGQDGYSVAKGSIELPPADNGSTYTVKSVEVSNESLSLVEAAKDGVGASAKWERSGSSVDIDAQRKAMFDNPLSAFGFFMKPGAGFANGSASAGKVVSRGSMTAGGADTIIGTEIAGEVNGEHVVPQMEFFLTYYNDITASKDLGTVTVVLERKIGGKPCETTTASVQIVTEASGLSSLEIDLHATQAGTYAGKLYIPKGDNRDLCLVGVQSGGAALVAEGTSLLDGQFTVSMQTTKGNGWNSAGQMDGPCDLGGFDAAKPVHLGTTDGRYEAPIDFTLSNASNFSSKDVADKVILTLKDSGSQELKVTLRVHWEASAVWKASSGPGRLYNGLSSGGVTKISQGSAMTAVFDLSKDVPVGSSWVELRDGSGTRVEWPAGAKITLWSGTGYYHYEATGSEADKRIGLKSFIPMGGGPKLSGGVSGTVGVIVDLGPTSSNVLECEYALLLRNEGTADGDGARFAVNGNVAQAVITGTGGASRGLHEFELSLTPNLTPNSDTRFSGGVCAMLFPPEGESFPEGTAFKVGENSYYPNGGKVVIPLEGSGPWSVTMDTTATSGLSVGEHSLSAQYFATGANAGNASPLIAKADYSVRQNSAYCLSVSLGSDASRIVKPGDKLSFTASYSLENVTGPSTISVKALRKTADGAYENVKPWTVSGNDSLAETTTVGTQEVAVSVPESTQEGTYRLLFTLGDQEVPYNLIVSG